MLEPFFIRGTEVISHIWQRWFQELKTWDDQVLSKLLGTEDQIIITPNDDGTITLSLPQDIDEDADVRFATLSLDNSGLHIFDTNASHDLIIAVGSDLETSDKTLTLTTGNFDRTITLDGNPTLNDWFDQAVKAASSPTFVTETLTGLTASQLVKTDASKVLASTIGTVQVPICMDYYDAIPARGTDSNYHGGLLKLDDAASLNSGAPFVMTTKGVGKIVLVVNDGGGDDMVGDITATGTAVDRNTGVHTGGQTSVMTLTGVTTDNSSVDANGNVVHEFVKAYITDKWFYGVVTLTTADVTLTDLDTYHISFEQVNDSPNLVINTIDANLFCTNASMQFDAYLYTVHVTGDEANVDTEGELHVGPIGSTAALANKYFRARQGNIDEALDGTTDGFWVDVHHTGTPLGIEDVTISVWLTKTVTVELS